MELKKAIVISISSLAVIGTLTGALIVRGAEPTTDPIKPAESSSAQPATMPASTATSVMSPASMQTASAGKTPVSTPNTTASSDPRSQSGGGRSGRRGRTDSNATAAMPSTAASDAYAVLKTRSIFVKGDQTIASESRPRDTGGRASALQGAQESLLVFDGVILVNNEADALVEDRGSNTVVQVRPGEAVAGGKVSAITFDDLTFEVNGKLRHVAIGQTLEGLTPAPSSYSAPTSQPNSGTGGASGPASGGGTSGGAAPGGAAPGGTAPGGPPPGSASETSPDDILAKLRARRLQESGGK